MAGSSSLRGGEINSKTFGLSCLANWINRSIDCNVPIPRSVLQEHDPRALELAERLGIFRGHGTARQITCQQCDDAHAAEVIKTPAGVTGHYCLASGWVDLADDEITLLRFDRSTFLTTLGAAAGLRSMSAKYYANDRLACVGLVSRSAGHRDWILGYADKLEDHNVLSAVTDVLSRQFPKGPGLIVTPSRVNLNIPLPRKYRLVAFQDITLGTSNGLVFDWKAVETFLGNPAKVPGPRGRPSEEEISRGIWEAVHNLPDWPRFRLAQVKIIQSKWLEDVPCPSEGTIQNHIRKFEKEE